MGPPTVTRSKLTTSKATTKPTTSEVTTKPTTSNATTKPMKSKATTKKASPYKPAKSKAVRQTRQVEKLAAEAKAEKKEKAKKEAEEKADRIKKGRSNIPIFNQKHRGDIFNQLADKVAELKLTAFENLSRDELVKLVEMTMKVFF